MKNSMKSVTIAISMVIEKVNARRNLSLKVNVTSTIKKDTNILNEKLRY